MRALPDLNVLIALPDAEHPGDSVVDSTRRSTTNDAAENRPAGF